MKQVYVITGASSGIGFALCRYLAQHDKQVVAIARRRAQLDMLKDEFPKLITVISADLAVQGDRNKVIQQLSSVERILGLVNNAATNDPIALVEDFPLEEWHRQIAINVDAPIFLTKGLLPFLKNGRIINITTGTTNFVVSGVVGYAMTKAAINVFSKYLSAELQSEKILVAAAHPGIVKTGLIESIISHNDPSLGISKAQKHFEQDEKYLDANISAKFIGWLLLDAADELYTGDIIGIYNQKYQPLWHDKLIDSPYPSHIAPP